MEGLDGTFCDPQNQQGDACTDLEPQREPCKLGKRRSQRGKFMENKTHDQAWNKERNPGQPSNTNASATKTLAPDAPDTYCTEDEDADERDVNNGNGLAHAFSLAQPAH
jgi:hypothetical protein